MKPFIICLSLATLFQSCGVISTENTGSEISGTYVVEWENEYTKAQDTIVLEWEMGTDRCDIIRKTFSAQTINGKTLPGNHKHVQWVGIYNSKNKTLHVSNNGRILTIDPKQKTLKMGSTVYWKIL